MKKPISILFYIFLVLLVLPILSSAQQAGKQVPIKIPATNSISNALLYLPWDYNISGKKYPLILFGHGIAETTVGSLTKQGLPGIISNNKPPYAIIKGDTIHFIVLSITGQAFLSEKEMSDGAKDLIQQGIRIDPNRIYVTGLSAGARSTVGYISHQQMYDYQPVAASVPMSYTLTINEMNSGIWLANFNTFAGKGLWAFTGKTDTHTEVAEALVDSVNVHSPGNGRLTIYPGGHCCWMTYYDPKYREIINGKMMNIYEWMMQYSLDGKTYSPEPNQPPVANAGTDQNITLPTASAKLNGSTSHDPDGNIKSYRWTQSDGPGNAAFSSTTTATPTVTNLIAGVYVFNLTVTDNDGSTATDKTQVTVKNAANKVPKANAGGYQTITLPENSTKLNGSASYDPDGSIKSYKWVQYAGPANAIFSSTASATPTVSNLVAGVYTFDLTVTDNNGSSDIGRTQVTVNKAINQPPKANPGADQTIVLPSSSLQLNGSQSYDPDGSITSYKWAQSAGPAKATFSSVTSVAPTVSNLVAGVYTFNLTVTDNNGSADIGRKEVTVKNAVVNKPPRANAGGYQTITLPVSAVSLNASGSYDPDGSISAYHWTQFDGPADAIFSSTSTANPTVSSLKAGVYVFDLTVTDNAGGKATGRTQVTVKPSLNNKPPRANAGGYQTITLPVSAVSLNASGSYDPDGSISAYRWTQFDGPADAIFSSTSTANPTVSNLEAGVYVFDLTVTDNNGGKATGRTQVTVKPSLNNKHPKANAGGYQTITLPKNTIQLNASRSYDVDGNIVSYKWHQFDGPADATFSSKTSPVPTVSNLVAGVYVFDLSVTDNDGASTKGRTQVTVFHALEVSGLHNIAPFSRIKAITSYTDRDSLFSRNDNSAFAIDDNHRKKDSTTSSLNIYPNPVRNILQVSFYKKVAGSVAFRVINIDGQVIKTFQYSETAGKIFKSLNVESLVPGIYFVQLLENNKLKVTKKIIKY